MSFGTDHRSGGDGDNELPDGTSVHLALYKFDSCPYCRRVIRAIDDLGVKVEYRDIYADPRWRVDLYERTHRTTVPCLFIDDVPMFESADIVRWLQARFETAS